MEIVSSEKKQELEKQSNSIMSDAQTMVIANQGDNTSATLLLRVIKITRVHVTDTFKPAVTSAKKAYDETRALRDNFLKPIENAENILRQKIGYFTMQENARLADIAEAQAKARLKELKKAERKAEKTGAPVILPIAPAPAPTKIAAQSGVHHAVRWSAEVTDIVALCRAIGSGKALPGLVTPNMAALNKLAQVSKENLKIAGVEPVKSVSVCVR